MAFSLLFFIKQIKINKKMNCLLCDQKTFCVKKKKNVQLNYIFQFQKFIYELYSISCIMPICNSEPFAVSRILTVCGRRPLQWVQHHEADQTLHSSHSYGGVLSRLLPIFSFLPLSAISILYYWVFLVYTRSFFYNN